MNIGLCIGFDIFVGYSVKYNDLLKKYKVRTKDDIVIKINGETFDETEDEDFLGEVADIVGARSFYLNWVNKQRVYFGPKVKEIGNDTEYGGIFVGNDLDFNSVLSSKDEIIKIGKGLKKLKIPFIGPRIFLDSWDSR
ncbi:MAG: hypothetical protein AABY32_02010 [Nanoarchaeota archaeon]